MSASETGEDAPLIHFFSSVRNIDRASAPASRTVSCSSAASRVRRLASGNSASAKRQSLDAHRRRIDAVAELEIVGRLHRLEDLEQMAGDRDFAHGIGELA